MAHYVKMPSVFGHCLFRGGWGETSRQETFQKEASLSTQWATVMAIGLLIFYLLKIPPPGRQDGYGRRKTDTQPKGKSQQLWKSAQKLSQHSTAARIAKTKT